MASTSTLLSGLSGLTVNARRLEVIGNNIANVNVAGFKSSRLNLFNSFSRNFSLGSTPSAESGGTNPGQIGLGATVAGTQRNMTNAPVVPTGVPTDIGIEGNGFFVVKGGGDTTYTRAGNFQINAANQLVSADGKRVQGYGIDENFNIVSGRLTDVEIPLGAKTIAKATENVSLAGNLKADGVIATTGTQVRFGVLTTGGAPATLATALTALDPAAGILATDTFTLAGATRGSKTVPDATFTVGTATLGDFLNFIMDSTGIVPDGGFNTTTDPGPEPGGFTIDAAGAVTLTGNWGTANEIGLRDTNFVLRDAAGATKANPFTVASTTPANGESVRTGFVVYDSLGTALNVDLTMVLARTDSTGTYWRAFMHSAEDTDAALHLESGDRATPGAFSTEVALMKFDNFGRLANGPKVNVEFDRLNIGSADPLKFDIAFDSGADRVTAFANTGGSSQIAAKYQDGSPIGSLTNFSISDNGVVTGGFSNGLTRNIGQLALSAFTNPEGLIDIGNLQFRAGPNSGDPVLTTPTQFGTGRLIGGALEQSNVDLSKEFIEMIQSSTGYAASSRIISTADQLLQQLIATAR
ncbi:MAG: flagellar hook protein FlgE [Phycisphaerales bacterium]